jgi:hypothetical protein
MPTSVALSAFRCSKKQSSFDTPPGLLPRNRSSPRSWGRLRRLVIPRHSFGGKAAKGAELMSYRFDPHQCLQSHTGLDSSNSPKRLFLCRCGR